MTRIAGLLPIHNPTSTTPYRHKPEDTKACQLSAVATACFTLSQQHNCQHCYIRKRNICGIVWHFGKYELSCRSSGLGPLAGWSRSFENVTWSAEILWTVIIFHYALKFYRSNNCWRKTNPKRIDWIGMMWVVFDSTSPSTPANKFQTTKNYTVVVVLSLTDPLLTTRTDNTC